MSSSTRHATRPALAIVYIILLAVSFAYTQDLAHPLPDAIRTTLGLPACLALAAYGYVLHKTLRRPAAHDVPTAIVSLILSLFWVLGRALSQLKTIVPLFQDASHTAKTLLAIATIAVFAHTLATPLFDRILARHEHAAEKSLPSTATQTALDHLIRLAPVVLLVAWAPMVVAQLPGSTSFDMNFMLAQVTGSMHWNTHHPLEATLLYGAIFSLGRALGGNEAGFLLITLFQTAAYVAACTFELRTIERLGAPRWALAASLAFFALNPIFSCYCQWDVKDSLFGAAFVAYLSLFALYAKDPTAFAASRRSMAALVAAAFLTGVLRKNGLYVVALSLPFLTLLHTGARQRLRAAVPLVIAVALVPASGAILKAVLRAEPGAPAEALSIPFQQTARYALLNADDVEPWEREAIGRTLDYDRLPQAYDWAVSDPVKNTLISADHLPEYLRAWASQGLRHPATYLDATLLQTYGYWYPSLANDYKQEYAGFAMAGNNGITATKWLPEGARSLAQRIPAIFKAIPGLGHLSYLGIYTGALLRAAALLLRAGRPGRALISLPGLVLTLTCVAGPLNGSMRYGMGVVATLPLLLAAATLLAQDAAEKSVPHRSAAKN